MKTIEQRVLKFIDNNSLINEGDKIIVSLSGGPDSIFLIKFLKKFRRRLKIDLAAFHLNHRLRGKDADKDEEFCRRFCSHNKIKLVVKKRDVRKRGNEVPKHTNMA